VAAWSGPGLRGATITAIQPTADGVWVGTQGGGLAWWDGTTWAHLDRRTIGGDAIVGLVVAERTRWIGLPDALVRVSPEGALTQWAVGQALPGVALLQVVDDGAGGVWARTDAALVRVAEGVVEVRRVACAPLVQTPDGPIASCGGGARRLLDDARVDLGGDDVLDWIGRADGAWVATPTSVYGWVKAAVLDPWSPPSGNVRHAARVGDGLAIAADLDGLYLRTVDGWRHLGAAEGLPGSRALGVVASPAFGRAWVGTDRGLALANVGGTATPLPLAPLAAGIPVSAIEVWGTSAGFATQDGLRWVGRGAPVGWRALTVAVGAPARALTRVDDVWWAASDDTLFSLDDRGGLQRWPLHEQLVALAHDASRLWIATERGLRWWVPGATMLSPLEPMPGVVDLALGPDGSRWVLDRAGLVHTPQGEAWAVEDGAALEVVGGGAVVAAGQGLAWFTSGREQAAWTAADTGPIVDVDSGGGRIWALGADGRLWTSGGDPPVAIDLGADIGPHAVRADAWGAWVGSDAGVFRVLP
jgi:ligand-binding sensor domain-containing protein